MNPEPCSMRPNPQARNRHVSFALKHKPPPPQADYSTVWQQDFECLLFPEMGVFAPPSPFFKNV